MERLGRFIGGCFVVAAVIFWGYIMSHNLITIGVVLVGVVLFYVCVWAGLNVVSKALDFIRG